MLRLIEKTFNNSRLTDQRGVALLIALFAMMIMMVIAVELTYDTTVDYQTSAQAVNRLKAYYAARAGVELSLLRIRLYRKVVSQLGSTPQVPISMLDPIWQIPFTWPPILPDDIGKADKENIQETVKKSPMQAQYATRIESEGSKLDINDLASNSKLLADSTHAQIVKMFQAKIQQDEQFAKRYRDRDFDRLVNFITDWITPGTTSLNGGDKASYYSDNNPENNHFIPPMQPFKTVDELHMVHEMNDDFYDVLAPKITVYGTKGINVNYANKETLMALDPGITSEIADDIITRRDDPGPFTNKDDFITYLKSKNVNPANLDGDNAIPLYFDSEFNFRITSTATFGKSSREIVAVVYDFDQVKQRLVTLLTDQDKKSQAQSPGQNNQNNPATPPPQGNTPAPNNNQQTAVQSGRPNVVYWQED